MATALSRHKNPINIAPLVDVLLILFVILVVAARFDVGEETKQLKVELNNTKTAVEASKDAAKLKELLAKLNKLELENEKLKNKQPRTELAPEKTIAPSKTGGGKDESAALKKEIESLKERLRMAMSGRLQIIVDIEDDAIYVNEKRLSMDDAKIVFDAVAPRHYKLNWSGGSVAKAKAEELEKYLIAKGYEFEK